MLGAAIALALVGLWVGPARAAAPQGLGSLEMAVTYAHGALQVYEIGAAAQGSVVALPLARGASSIRVTGGPYTVLRGGGGAGDTALVRSAGGQASVRYQVATATNRDFLFSWRTEVPIDHLVLLTGPAVKPSGLGLSPLTLGGRVEVAGQQLVSFTARHLPAGFTERRMLELGQPGGWIADLLVALGVALPLLFLLLALRDAWPAGRRRPA